MASRRIQRDRRLTPEEAEKYRKIREAVEKELPEIIARHHQAMKGGYGNDVLRRLKAIREAAGLSLADMAAKTGMDKATLSRLENGLQPNPTLETISRYAAALGKRVVWELEDLPEAESQKGAAR